MGPWALESRNVRVAWLDVALVRAGKMDFYKCNAKMGGGQGGSGRLVPYGGVGRKCEFLPASARGAGLYVAGDLAQAGGEMFFHGCSASDTGGGGSACAGGFAVLQ